MPVRNNQELKELLEQIVNRPLREGQLSDKEQLDQLYSLLGENLVVIECSTFRPC